MKALVAKRDAWIRWGSLALIVVSLVLLLRVVPTGRALELMQAWIDDLGVWGPLVFGMVYVLAALAFAPGSILTLAGGALFGLVQGTIVVSLAATTAAGLAFLIARYVARERVRRWIDQSPKLKAVDEAIGEQGWKIVALLRLSPAVPFNLQNYLYGVTAITFWPCVLTSWLAMLPGTILYVYLGSLGRTAVKASDTSPAEWALRGTGLLATVVVTIYIARLARTAIRERTAIETAHETPAESAKNEYEIRTNDPSHPPWATVALAAIALVLLATSIWATIRRDAVRDWIERGVQVFVVSHNG